jgi:hypothetical protein
LNRKNSGLLQPSHHRRHLPQRRLDWPGSAEFLRDHSLQLWRIVGFRLTTNPGRCELITKEHNTQWVSCRRLPLSHSLWRTQPLCGGRNSVWKRAAGLKWHVDETDIKVRG